VYESFSFTAYNNAPYTARIRVYDYKAGKIIWERMLEPGVYLYEAGINITGVDKIELSAEIIGTPLMTLDTFYNAVYLFDPMVDKTRNGDKGNYDEPCTCGECKDCDVFEHCLDCGGELCEVCEKCLDCEECEHCLDCGGKFREDCNECVECNTNPCQNCCIHSWSDWTVQSHDENGHTQSRSCSKCDAEDIRAESHTRNLSSVSWDWNVWDWVSVTQIKTLEDLLNTTITLGEDSCQYRYKQCVICDYLEYEVEDHKYNDDWDMRNYYEIWNVNTGKSDIVHVEPYYMYFSYNEDFVPGSGDGRGDSISCYRIKSCINFARSPDCPRLTDDKESHLFKMHNECQKWQIHFGEKRLHYFHDFNENKYYYSLSEIGNFDEIVTWLSKSGTRVHCSAGWCSRCSISSSRAALTPQITEWHEWEGMCRRTITCINNEQYDNSIMMFITIDICYDILFEETKPHNMIGNTCIDCGYTEDSKECKDPECTKPDCPEHGNSIGKKCYFCWGTEKCGICGRCSVCFVCRHCTDCNDSVWHNFEQYDPELGYHLLIVPELIGEGTWEDIIEWLSNEQNFINCFGSKCSDCSNRQGTKITPIVNEWHEIVYSNGYSVCTRSITCSGCGDIVYDEAKVHNFVGDTCVDCGAIK
jgi:hypothetical protein